MMTAVFLASLCAFTRDDAVAQIERQAERLAELLPEPLASWADGATKKAIIDFVARVTTPGGTGCVPMPERIQVAFAFDRIKAMAPQHPEWKAHQPFKALLENDMKGFAASGEKGLLKIMAATHTGMTA